MNGLTFTFTGWGELRAGTPARQPLGWQDKRASLPLTPWALLLGYAPATAAMGLACAVSQD